MATAEQIRIYNVHKQVCLSLGIPQYTLAHKHLKGTESPPSATGNIVYTGPGMLTTFTGEYASQTLVWFVSQPFLRGEEREEEYPAGVISVPLQQAQFPAIDDNQNLVPYAQDDFIIAPDGVTLYRIVNPIISPELSYITCMVESQR